MLVTINSVGITRAPKGYSVAEVEYVRDGKTEKRKVMSFVNESVFAKLAEFKTFPIDVNVTLAKEAGKDGKEYWQWKGIETNGNNTPASKPLPGTGKVVGSNYETPTERAQRQVYIVRQSSISSALAYYTAKEPKGITATIEDVLALAQQFEKFVLNVDPQPE